MYRVRSECPDGCSAVGLEDVRTHRCENRLAPAPLLPGRGWCLSYHSPGIRKSETLAFAEPYEGTIVLFPDRVHELNRNGGPSLLAHVLVHEITHVLEGICRHSATGVMKDRWDRVDYFEMGLKPLPFAQEDIHLIYDDLKVQQARVTTAPTTAASGAAVAGQ